MNRNVSEKVMALTNSQLRKSNQALRKNLKRVIECSSDNEKAQERMDDYEALVFEAESLKEMFDSMITQGRRIFDVQFITVALEPDYEKFYPEQYKKSEKSFFMESENIFFAPAITIALHFPEIPQVVLQGRLRYGNDFFFPCGAAQKIRSEALIPLRTPDGSLTGALCFGSSIPQRFMEGYGTRFLDRLGRLVSLKMEVFRSNHQTQVA
ncbi:MAG: DUF484 family protein [Nitrospinota bacterium]|nr:DUF484 family protein [Nitrospinota bacterium]